MTIEHDLWDLRELPYGTARTAATEAITKRIEAEGPREHLAMALLDLVEAYTFTDDGSKAFVVFARLLRLWDEAPELFDESDQRNLFWEFKWVAADLPEYPQITRAQAEAFLNDMEWRFRLAGHGISSVRMSRFRWAWHAGDPDAEEARLAWISGMRDEFEDCAACTIGQQVEFFTETGRFDEAVELARTQEFSCNLEPARTRYALAVAALECGDPDLAGAALDGALASDDGGSTDFGPARGKGLEARFRGGELERALRDLRNDHLQLLRGGASPLLRLRFLRSLLAGLSAHADADLQMTGLPEAEWRTVGALRAWVLSECEALAVQFDRRNGNVVAYDAVAAAQRAVLAPVPLRRAESTSAPAGGLGADPGAGPDAGTGVGAGEGASEPSAADAEQNSAGRGADGYAEAEQHAALRQYGLACSAYEQAAVALEAEGWLERAGLAYAEAGQCAALAGDEARSHRAFAAALPRLRAGGASASIIVPVLEAWAPVASRMGDSAEHLSETLAALDRSHDFSAEGLSEELAERRRREWLLQRAALRDTLARSIAAAPATEPAVAGASRERAIAEALLAGEEFAQLGRIADAAHAFWLAGRVQRDAGLSEDAIWSLESAVEGFAVARRTSDRARAAGDLIELLRATGQSERADAIVAQL